MGYTTTGTPVSLAEIGAGEAPNSAWFSDLSGAMNHAHAFNTAQPINQGWPDGNLDASLGNASNEVARWRIPMLGTAHNSLAVEVEGMASLGSGGTVQLISNSGNTLTLTFNGARSFQSGTLTVDTASTYDEIVMKVIPAGAGDQLKVYGINSALNQVGSAGLSGTRSRVSGSSYWVHPLPTEITPNNHPISSFVGHALHSSMGSLTRRPRSLVCWSGIPAPGQNTAIKRYNTANTNRCWIVRNQQGSKAASRKYTVHAQVKNASASAKSLGIELVRPEVSQRSISSYDARISIPGNTNAATWVTGEIVMPEDGRLPSTASPASVHSFTSVALTHVSDVECLSFSIWGE